MAKKLNIDITVSNSESIADAKTAIEPEATPMANFTIVKIVAIVVAIIVALFCGDILPHVF